MYKELKKIYDKERLDVFSMAIQYLTDVGYRDVSKLSDEDIKEFEGNGLMTADFVQYIATLAKRITEVTDSATEVIQFCQAEDVFDTKWYANKPSRETLSNIAYNAVGSMMCKDYNGNSVDDLCNYLNTDENELLALNLISQEEYDKAMEEYDE